MITIWWNLLAPIAVLHKFTCRTAFCFINVANISLLHNFNTLNCTQSTCRPVPLHNLTHNYLYQYIKTFSTCCTYFSFNAHLYHYISPQYHIGRVEHVTRIYFTTVDDITTFITWISYFGLVVCYSPTCLQLEIQLLQISDSTLPLQIYRNTLIWHILLGYILTSFSFHELSDLCFYQIQAYYWLN